VFFQFLRKKELTLCTVGIVLAGIKHNIVTAGERASIDGIRRIGGFPAGMDAHIGKVRVHSTFEIALKVVI
jgi:hypothetical protein